MKQGLRKECAIVGAVLGEEEDNPETELIHVLLIRTGHYRSLRLPPLVRFPLRHQCQCIRILPSVNTVAMNEVAEEDAVDIRREKEKDVGNESAGVGITRGKDHDVTIIHQERIRLFLRINALYSFPNW